MMNTYEPFECPNCGKIFTVNRVASYSWLTPPEMVNRHHYFCFECGTVIELPFRGGMTEEEALNYKKRWDENNS